MIIVILIMCYSQSHGVYNGLVYNPILGFTTQYINYEGSDFYSVLFLYLVFEGVHVVYSCIRLCIYFYFA